VEEGSGIIRNVDNYSPNDTVTTNKSRLFSDTATRTSNVAIYLLLQDDCTAQRCDTQQGENRVPVIAVTIYF
jgi:hypothetical protein